MKIACIIQCSHQIGGDLRLLWGHVHRIQLQLPLLVHRFVIDIRLRMLRQLIGSVQLGNIILQLQVGKAIVIIIVIPIIVLLEYFVLRKLLV